jgi:hypothetical protein
MKPTTAALLMLLAAATTLHAAPPQKKTSAAKKYEGDLIPIPDHLLVKEKVHHDEDEEDYDYPEEDNTNHAEQGKTHTPGHYAEQLIIAGLGIIEAISHKYWEPSYATSVPRIEKDRGN